MMDGGGRVGRRSQPRDAANSVAEKKKKKTTEKMTVADEPAAVPPPAKKAKAAVDASSVLRPSLLEPASLAALAKSYAGAAPFPHAQLEAVFDPAILRAARDEIVEHVQATYKETDLFKVFQTGEWVDDG
jgi:prolyl 3-hydroxylase /prolyl 3,4-dihydroxylase